MKTGMAENSSLPSRGTRTWPAGFLQLTAHTMCAARWPFDVEADLSRIHPRCSVVRFFVNDHAAVGNHRREVLAEHALEVTRPDPPSREDEDDDNGGDRR